MISGDDYGKIGFRILCMIGLMFVALLGLAKIFGVKTVFDKDNEKENNNLQIIVVQKDSTIKQLKVEMTDEVQKAINADDSTAIKQFIELVTK